MIGVETQGIERKVLSILKVLSDSQAPLGARVVAQHLRSYGVELGERAVRYHLNSRDTGSLCWPMAEEVIAGLREARLGGVLVMGNASETVYEISVELNRIGMVFIGGLNPVAAVAEAGIATENHAMSAAVEYQKLIESGEL